MTTSDQHGPAGEAPPPIPEPGLADAISGSHPSAAAGAAGSLRGAAPAQPYLGPPTAPASPYPPAAGQPWLPPQTSQPWFPPQIGQPGAPAPLTKAGLRRDTRRLVLAYAGCLVVIQIVGAIVGGVAVIFDPAVRDMINDMIANSSGGIDLNSQTIIDAFSRYSGLASVAGLVAGASCFFAIRGKRLVTSDLTIVGERVRLPVIGQLFVLMMAVQLLASLMTAVLSWLGIDITGSYESGIESIAASPIGLVYVVLLGPFLEELIFRGAVLRHLQPYGKNFAIITSAVMFGLYHMILFQAAYAIPVGIILAYTASRFSLKWSLALHIANNGLAMLSLTGVPEAVFLIFYVLCGAGAVAIFALRRSEVRALPAAGAPVLDHPYQIAWSHPLFIIAALILLATGVLLLL